ncbi:MAG: extracellular solute-binding protein [Bacteroidetes bacterium]|nr:extracellular solute-binding protein [Bacteroidota bacterium]
MSTLSKILISISVAVVVIFILFVVVPEYHHEFFTSERSAQKVYFADHISPAHEAVIRRFNELHQGKIEIVPVNLPFSKFSTNERKELLARSLRSKSDRLDIFSVDYIWTQRFAKWSEPLDSYFSDQDKSVILSPTLQSCTGNGSLVAMPLYIDIGMMYYRKDLLASLPHPEKEEEIIQHSMTWNEMFALRKRLGMEQQPFYLYQANDYEGLVCNYFEMIASLDSTFFTHNTIDLQKPAAKKALQILVDFVYKYKISPPEVTAFDENKSYDYLLNHNVMFVRGWPNFVESYLKRGYDSSKFINIRRAPLPHFEGEMPTSVYGGWNLMVSQFSTKKSAAIEFIRFLQTKEAQEILFDLGGYIPVNRFVYEDTTFVRTHPYLLFYRKLVERGFHRPFLEDYTRISDIIAHFVHRAIKKEISVETALQEASTMIANKQVLIK